MAKFQDQFGPRKWQYFEEQFLSAYSTCFKVPETRGGKKYFSETLIDGPLNYTTVIVTIDSPTKESKVSRESTVIEIRELNIIL